MKYLYPATAFVLFILFASCSNQPESKESLAAPILPFSTNPVVPSTTNTVLPAKNDSAAVVLSAKNDSTIAAKEKVALNPQHGQPGHRCDIAVGAPLNSPATIQTNVSTKTPSDTSAKTNINTVAKKAVLQTDSLGRALNPKHGEPGHRCDIAVGAPLNNKPAQ